MSFSESRTMQQGYEDDGTIHQLEELGFEQSFAFLAMFLVANTFLHVRIKYGSMVVTHMTTWPYKIIFFFLIVAIIESVMLLILDNIVFAGHFENFLRFTTTNAIFKLTLVAFEIAKIALVFVFVLS